LILTLPSLTLGLKRRGDQIQPTLLQPSPEKGTTSLMDMSGKILGKTYFRDPEVNKGFYSKKRDGVADVDPKVSNAAVAVTQRTSSFNFIWFLTKTFKWSISA